MVRLGSFDWHLLSRSCFRSATLKLDGNGAMQKSSRNLSFDVDTLSNFDSESVRLIGTC